MSVCLCVSVCECLSQEVELKRAQLCMAIGDCGPKLNYVGSAGNTKGYTFTTEKVE